MKFNTMVFKYLGFSLLFLLLTTSFSNQTKKETTISKSQEMVFNTENLYFAEFYDFIYRGHFEHLKIKSDSTEFLMLFDNYLRAYGKQCSQYLPANKVDIMDTVCATEEVGKNIYGEVIRRDCVEYAQVPSGLFARPELYKAKREVERVISNESLEILFTMMTDDNAMGNAVDKIHKQTGLKNDMALIFKQNPGNSVGIKRFEENLKLFALNKEPIRMQEQSKYLTMKTSGGPTGSHNLSLFINDLVANQAKTWMLNRYVSGSISNVQIIRSDNAGRPAVLSASYVYNGFSGKASGGVKIDFTNGLPTCIYFADFPQNCKTPSSSIVAAYAEGKYKN